MSMPIVDKSRPGRVTRQLRHGMIWRVIALIVLVGGFTFILLLGSSTPRVVGVAIGLTLGLAIFGSLLLIMLRRSRAGLRARQRQLHERFPSAFLVYTEWNATAIPYFLKDESSFSGTDTRGFGVDLVADSDGIHFWRDAAGLPLLGTLRWAQVWEIKPALVPATLGSREFPALHFNVAEGVDFVSEFDLICREADLVQVCRLIENKRTPG